MDAWQQGEISNALTKLALVLELDRRAPDSSSPERTSYQNLYDQVRSEHDALNNAYAEMCKHRADGNLSNALQLCDTWMSKYPNNALFQALKFDLEEQKRQELSAFIATVDRQVEGEPDLDKRVGILKEALKVHPGRDPLPACAPAGGGQAGLGELDRGPSSFSRGTGTVRRCARRLGNSAHHLQPLSRV